MNFLTSRRWAKQHATCLGGVPTTPDPDTSAKILQYKWEPYRGSNWWHMSSNPRTASEDCSARVSRVGLSTQ